MPTKGKIRVESIAAPTRPAAVEGRILSASIAIVVIATTRGSSVAPSRRRGRGARSRLEDSAVEQQGRGAADDEEEGEEEQHLGDRFCRAEGGEVELDAAGDEEEGDEEAEADRGQLRLEDLQLVAAQRRPGDHAGDEAAEQDVEAELAGQQDQAEDEDDGDPHRQLAARLEGFFQRRPAAPGERTEARATPSARTMKASRITASCRGLAVERTRVTSRIGPNSPAPPAAIR